MNTKISHANILAAFLSSINYKFTSKTIRKFQDNPIKDSLLGISETLSQLGIKTEGYKITDIKELPSTNVPFITIKGGNFVLVNGISNEIISYTIGKHHHIEDLQTFSKDWSHTILTVVQINRNGEPHFSRNRVNEISLYITKITIITLSCLIFGLLGLFSGFWHNPYSIVTLIFNVVGLFFSVLLYTEYLNIESNTTKKICGIIKDADCEKVSSSHGSKVFNLFHLSEIGCAFFLMNIIAIVVFDINIVLLSIISFFSLIFCIWSPIYQKFVVKKWCTLCLIIVLILLLQAIFFGYIQIFNSYPSLYQNIHSLLILILLASSYITTTVILFYISKIYNLFIKNKYIVRDYTDLKYNSAVFNLLLHSSQRIKNFTNSALIFGNPNSTKRITVVSNPFCISCIANHSQLNKLSLEEYRIEYILTAFDEKFLFANYNLIAYYHKFGSDKAWKLLTDWYETNNKTLSFFNEFNLEISKYKDTVLEQLSWITDEDIKSTPSVFLNGYKLPQQYESSDIPYFFL